MIKELVLYLALLTTPESDFKSALQNYKDYGYRCNPHYLHVEKSEYNFKDSTYIMQNDFNKIPWVTGVKSRVK